MIKNSNSVHVFAPKESPAFNSGRGTIHRMFEVNLRKIEQELSGKEKEDIQKLYHALAHFSMKEVW